MNELPLGLRHAIETGECVLFIGSGIGHYYFDQNGKCIPDGYGLAKRLAEHFNIPVGDEKYSLTKISKIIELRKGRAELLAFIKSILLNIKPDDTVLWLTKINWKAIFTTNYDNGIQTAYNLSPDVKQNPKTFITTSDLESFDQRFDVPIFHLHGAIFDTERKDIIITDDDYTKFYEKRRMLFEILKKECATSTILYIGYSNEDPNWRMVLREIEEEFYPTSMPTAFRVAPGTDPIDVEILKDKNIECLDLKYHEFVELAETSIVLDNGDISKISKLRTHIPNDLIDAFDKNPVPTSRLLNSWHYVNQAAFNVQQNLDLFLKGDRPTWALIGQKLYFERDIEEELYDELLDYATSTKKSIKTSILLSPAGYGVSTLLMILAVKLIKDRAGKVFMLKPGAMPMEGDLLYAKSIFKDENVYFFIDNAADHKGRLRDIIQKFKELKLDIMFFLGERINEWRQNYESIKANEFLLNPLSDLEIKKLIEYLGKSCALNKLEYLTYEMQFNAIKKNFNQELLVAMKEATDGMSFDAILEDEFIGIQGEIPRKAYLIVSCFYQYNIYIRNDLLASILGLSITDLYDQIKDQTEGVILFDEINSANGTYAARARHRKIAEIVWERCGYMYEKDLLFKKIIENLNLNYKIDASAFECLYRSDKLVDSFSSIDKKINFFEKACKKDPLSPYVRQHYARMLYREDKFELALSQIENALNNDKSARVLYHTKGLILSKMAFENESMDMARRRLIQSETSYKHALSMNPKDPYCYQGLSQLYLGWAKKSNEKDEFIEYLSKAEQIISDGLKKVSDRDKLWIESANIQEVLGNHPGYIEYLERAIIESPSSIYPRYILGRTYRLDKNYEKAISVLEPIILNHQDEFRSFVEYAISLHKTGKSYDECISILRLSTLYGFSDPRFVSVLGGLYFLNKNYSEAKEVFEKCNIYNFSVIEKNKIQFQPINIKINSRYNVNGVVVSVKAGYSYVNSEDFPEPLICPGSKYRGLIMNKGMNVSYDLSFRAAGPIAENIVQI